MWGACAAVAVAASASASTIFNGYAYVSSSSSPGVDATWDSMSGTGLARDLDGADFGDFESHFWLGGQTGFWAEGQGVNFIDMHYSITGDATASGTISFAFQHYSAPDDQWGTDVNGSNASDASVDLIATHSLGEGDSQTAVWTEGQANGRSSIYDSNGGNNSNATFFG